MDTFVGFGLKIRFGMNTNIMRLESAEPVLRFGQLKMKNTHLSYLRPSAAAAGGLLPSLAVLPLTSSIQNVA